MPQNKKQHYVPRFYLKRFTHDERFINLYNLKTEKKIVAAKLKGQCFRNYLYGQDGPIEEALSHVESGSSELMRKMDHYQIPPPPGTEDHYLMMVYLMMQRGRTIYAAEAINEMFDKMTKESFSDYFMQKEGIDLSAFNIGIEQPANYALGLSMQTYPLLFDMHYKLLINRTHVEFITSDNPVVLYNQLFNFRAFGSNCGLACKGLQIFFPVDSKKLIAMYDGATYRVGGNRLAVDITNPQDVYALNTLQICSAVDNVYFNDAAIDISALHRKARPYLRTSRAVVTTSATKQTSFGSEKLVGMASQDIRTNLQVSAITIRGSAKRWRQTFMRQKFQPVAVVRNQELTNDYEEFNRVCEAKMYQPSQFIDFVADKYKAKT